MATSRQDCDCAPERKRARVVVESSSAPLSTPSGSAASLSRWDWSTASGASVPNVYYSLAPRNDGSPGVNGNSSDSISLSGSEQGGGASQKSSPVATPVVVSDFNMTIPKSVAVASSSNDMSTSLVGSGLLQTLPVVTAADLRPCLIRSPTLVDAQDGNANAENGPAANASTASAVGVVAPWQLQDFSDGLAFDGSLSGLSDLAGSGYVNEMMEFVKRQSSHPSGVGGFGGDGFFQYILMAPTSAAVKLHEEPLTYLNQGQSYEIKCKKLGAEGMVPGRLFKVGASFQSIVRITFHDRRQKFHERELMDQWKKMHAGEKITDADLPMSYNIFNVRTDLMGTMLEFLWDPTKSTSAFIKVNCISTEFTARKHGGEKGVPFRLQVDTYLYGDDVEHKHLHSSYAQVKVFKTKGADRKNKTDRERAEKRAEREKYQPAYDYTILAETFPTDVYDFEQQQQLADAANIDESVGQRESSPVAPKPPSSPPSSCNANSSGNAAAICSKAPDCQKSNVNAGRSSLCSLDSGVSSRVGAVSPLPAAEERDVSVALPVDATPTETMQWLRRQRFGAYLKVFSSFSGADFLRSSREDLIQICGTADGIRLFNALQYKKVQPKLTLYMCVPGAPAFHAIFLLSLTLQELARKVCDLIQVESSQVFDVYCQGPDGINVHMNDEVVQNLPDRSRYIIDAMKCGDEQSERYRILLKATTET